jgi:hypothetical protein
MSKHDPQRSQTPWLGLFSLWLSFAVLAWLWSLAKRH